MNSIKEIAKHFDLMGEIVSVETIGMGHINSTLLITTKHEFGAYEYVFQKINTLVFKDIEGLMNNIFFVTDYIRKGIVSEGGDAARSTLMFIKTKDNKKYYTAPNGDIYRCYLYISNVASIQVANSQHNVYLAGIGFGRFQKYLSGFDASLLIESIPDFHNTAKRFETFEQAVNNDICSRAKNIQKEIEFFHSRKEYASRIVNLIQKGDIPLRVTHNDTKLNNVLIDTYTDSPVAVIDLDTVMSGSVLYDFGDSIRTCANTGAEDETDLQKVNFSLEMFEAFTQGFVGEMGKFLTQCEIDNLAFGAILMTYECGMRFLTDYLCGDAYFRIQHKNHNLERAHTQMKMVEDMEKFLPQMNAIVKKYAK